MDKTQIERSKTNLRGMNLSGADLRAADLSGADLRDADLSDADLRDANLRETKLSGTILSKADLRGADLRGADIDFSSFPLWCGSLGAIVDEKMIFQLLYHILRLCQNNEELPNDLVVRLLSLKDLANKFHRANECGLIE